MNLNLFSCSGGGYLVCPDCMLMPSEAQNLHGAVLQHLGIIDSDCFAADIRSLIERDIDERLYAHVPQRAVDECLEHRHHDMGHNPPLSPTPSP